MNRVISVAFLPVMVISVGVVLLAVIGAGPSGTPTASASHAPVNLVAIDFTTLGNSATTVGTIDPCAAVPSATQTDLTFDLVATGIPAETLESDRMNIFEVHIAYDDPATGASPDGFTPVPDQSGAAALAVQSADRNFYISSGGGLFVDPGITDPLPDTGDNGAGVAQFNNFIVGAGVVGTRPTATEGLLARLVIRVNSTTPDGVYALNLIVAWFTSDNGTILASSLQSGFIGVGGPAPCTPPLNCPDVAATVPHDTPDSSVALPGCTGGTGTIACALTVPPSHGAASVTDCTSSTYTPSAGFCGFDSFIYTGTDSADPPQSDSGTVHVFVQCGPTATPPPPTPPPPSNCLATNDHFANAVPIPGLPFGSSTSTFGCTTEPGEPASCAPEGATVWYAFTAAADMAITVDTFGSNFDTVLAAYTGSSLASLTAIGCNDQFDGAQSKIAFSATAGTTYYFQVGGYFGQTGTLVLRVAPSPPPPGNDDFANARAVASLPFAASLDTGGATTEAEEPTSICAVTGATVWYAFTPSEDMTIAAETYGSQFSTVVAAFTGTSFSDLQPFGCRALFNRLVLDLSAGTTYYFQVGGFFGEAGNLAFSLATFVPLEVSVSIDEIGSVAPRTGVASVSGVVTCNKSASVDLTGLLWQQTSPYSTSEYFTASVQCDGATRWHATVWSNNVRFVAGPAGASVTAIASGLDEFDASSASGTVLLRGNRSTSGSTAHARASSSSTTREQSGEVIGGLAAEQRDQILTDQPPILVGGSTARVARRLPSTRGRA